MPLYSFARRVAKHGRDAAYRILSVVERITTGTTESLLPPLHLRVYYYRTWHRERFARACSEARTELMLRGLRPEHRVLDIGSGIGNLAVGLTDFLQGAYEGVEVHHEAVTWCQNAITPRYPRFRFHHADIFNQAYNPNGAVTASAYRFPFPDRSFDFVLLGSVFTHMLPHDVEHYVQEIGRMLTPTGVCVASYFLLNDQSREGVMAGRSFMSFDVAHDSGVCRLHSQRVPEAAVALEETFVREAHARAGLVMVDARRGHWWSGESHDQDVLAFSPTVAQI
jgi:SAM-dependent methyltransferase